LKKKPLLELMEAKFPDFERNTLYAWVMCGEIFVDDECVRNPGTRVSLESEISHRGKTFVSRGGIKLDYALRRLVFPVSDMVILDVGASTGGFTDCLLQNGAKHVHAVDVGANLLAYSLRVDTRVTVHEKTGIMSVSALEPVPDAATADVSFRSIRGAASKILELCTRSTALVLVKPQFEWKSPNDDFDGVVRRTEDIVAILEGVRRDLERESVFVEDVAASGLTGRRGNREVFFLIGREAGKRLPDFEQKVRAELASFDQRESLESGSPT
jgi:23S rRNA (cytidine1920-2'-O)/16S rRNA (cytidine1409-2'-O)-methyltransferase